LTDPKLLEVLLDKINKLERLAVATAGINTVLLNIAKENNLINDKDLKDRMTKLQNELTLHTWEGTTVH